MQKKVQLYYVNLHAFVDPVDLDLIHRPRDALVRQSATIFEFLFHSLQTTTDTGAMLDIQTYFFRGTASGQEADDRSEMTLGGRGQLWLDPFDLLMDLFLLSIDKCNTQPPPSHHKQQGVSKRAF